MSVDRSVMEALADRLSSGMPGVAIAWPNLSFSPPADAYLRAAYVPAQPDAPFVGDGSTIAHLGVFQVDVFWPENGALPAALDLARTVAELFPRGLRLLRDGLLVRITRPSWVAAPVQSPGRLQLPVTISWTACAPT